MSRVQLPVLWLGLVGVVDKVRTSTKAGFTQAAKFWSFAQLLSKDLNWVACVNPACHFRCFKVVSLKEWLLIRLFRYFVLQAKDRETPGCADHIWSFCLCSTLHTFSALLLWWMVRSKLNQCLQNRIIITELSIIVLMYVIVRQTHFSSHVAETQHYAK